MDWQQLLEIDIDGKEDIQEIILKVWHIQATRTSGIRHYVVLLNDAIFYITLISLCWYLEPNIEQEALIQQLSVIILCSNSEDLPIPNSTFKHLFSIRSMIYNPYLIITKSNKIIYAKLFGLSKKVIDLAIKADMYQELSDMFKTFLYDIQNKIDKNQTGDYITNVNNPNITKHKGHLPKRLKSNVEQSSSKGKQVLRNSTHINVIDNNEINAEGEGSGDMINTKGRKCKNFVEAMVETE
ncbi:12592_t:CDS:2 [Funneliformis mosseae]|uniref:12592_t:CDS:1 n=1 Tax=Funneliformis mosseae TaxID=27381 RepID=A0A9N9ARA8_FUNMO|nr:12592_t:CDS:2 [Funneliformis mosseae]